jgi:putative acetyltransferase
LRPARDADSPAVVALIRRVLREYGLRFDPAGIDRPLYEIEARFRGPGRRFWVLEERGQIVGTAAIDRRRAGIAELKKMFLDRRHRGKGHGKRMLRAALAFARRSGYRRVMLETHSSLEEAIGLYVKAGFRFARKTWVPPRCDAVYVMDLSGGGG